MPSPYISAEQQRQVIERANRHCEYCKSSMDYASQPFVMEHIIPVSAKGETFLNNLALSCGGCNGHKYTKVDAIDPVSQTRISLFHPRQQTWLDHFSWSADYLQIIGITAIGRATVDALKGSNLKRDSPVGKEYRIEETEVMQKLYSVS